MTYDGPVRRSAELERILKLRRRVIDWDSKEVLDLAWEWSPILLNEAGKREWDRTVALPQLERDREFRYFGRRKDMKADDDPRFGLNCPLLLSVEQAVMLFEAYHNGGLFADAGVGTGKTLVAFLLTVILGAAVPVLFVPGALERQAHEDFEDLSRFWKTPRPLPQIVTYSKLGHPTGDLVLCNCSKCCPCEKNLVPPPPRPCACELCVGPSGIRPTHAFADEGHKFRNPSAACTKRMGRYMANHVATTNYYTMSGSPWRKSIHNSAPQLIWALKWNAPVPLTYIDRQEWSEALDLSSRAAPRDPGALLWLTDTDPKTVETYEERLELAARGWKERLEQTPGVVRTRGQSCDQPLTLQFLKAPDDPVLEAEFRRLRTTPKTLDGWDIDDPLSFRAYAIQTATGFHYWYDPRPPKLWLDKRAAAAKFVRERIAASGRAGRPLDSRAPVYAAYPNEPVLREWLEIEPTYEPEKHKKARPITASVFGYVVEWLKLNGPALVWTQFEYVGQTIAAMAGIPFYQSKGKDAQGRYIGKHPPTMSAVVSLKSTMEGKNLQAFNRAIVVGPTPTGTDWEQGYLGRMHRKGQNRPVFVAVLISCGEDLYAIRQAREEQTWVQSRGGGVGRLLTANYDWTHFPQEHLANLPLEHPARARWNMPK